MIQVLQNNFYNLDHKKISKLLEKDLEFCNTFCINDEYYPLTIYKTKEKRPRFFGVSLTKKRIIVRKINLKKSPSKQTGALCLKCKTAIHSTFVHHAVYCNCKSIYIDGGNCYTRICGNKEVYKIVKIDLIKNKIITNRKKRYDKKCHK